MNNSIFYNYNRIRSYNALFNFIISNRGGGKTYGAKKMCINNFLKRKEQFVYVRRYKSEIKEVRDNFFSDISQEFQDHELTVNGSKIYIDGEIAGYFIPLSVSQKYKSTAYPFVTTIVYDEFIIDKYNKLDSCSSPDKIQIQDFEKNTLSAEDYLSRAKKASDEKNYTEMYNNLQNFLLLAETNRDEGLFLMAQLYEGNSEYRNIKKSVETYEELTNSYPLSKYWDDANKRVIYLKRFYINIR